MEIRDVIDRAGGARRVAQELQISRAAVYAWTRVPAEHVLRVAALAQVRPSDVDPALYPPGLVA